MRSAPRDRWTALKEFAPFAGASFLAWIAVPIGSSVSWWQYSLSIGLAVLAGTLALLTMQGRRGPCLGAVPSSLLFLIAVGLLRNSAGGSPSGAGALSLIPVLYTALYSRSRRDLLFVLIGVAVFYLAPILIVGAPGYPNTQYRAALLTVTVSSIIGLATQRLVADVRLQAGEARNRERMIEQVSETVYRLFDSPRVRIDVCNAAKRISGANVALLYEPIDGSDRLHCTAMSGLESAPSETTASEKSAVTEVFASGEPKLVTGNAKAQVGSVALWELTGRPASIIYQPLLQRDHRRGVLVVGWPDNVRLGGSRTTVIALLAHEAAAVIARADAMDHLSDEAQTDPLSGLPNRRTWDLQLQHLVAEGRPLAIALLDFDHFKQFNDTHGHPAGDRLLKETAAAWRDALREGDFLARLGGEEFGLLLPECDAEAAVEVVERLRRSVSQGRTCSAGLTVRELDESGEAAVARADRALYRAKSMGRDRAHYAVVDDDVSTQSS